ncbi:MAG TPA: hypothetical protein VGC42_20910 [Kofleriaceae bacterium]
MKNLSIAFLAAMSLVSFAGCKKHGGAGETISKMTDFKDKMCKCADKACADKVTEEMTKWGQEQAKNAGADKDAKVSEEDTKKIAAVTEEMTKCMTKAMMAGAGAPPATPPAGSAAPAGTDPAAAPAGGSAAAPAGADPAAAPAGSAAAPAAGSDAKPAN